MIKEPQNEEYPYRKILCWSLGVGLVAFLVGLGVFLWLSKAFEPVPGLELLKVVLTVIGGIGAVVYLVVRFRTQAISEADDKRKATDELRRQAVARREEEQFIEDKLFRAIEMLGSNSVSTKIAGVYALTDVSDTYGGRYQQRVVDILCGYLRTPRGIDESSVESTIWKAIEERTKKYDCKSWSKMKFDFMDSTFHQIVRLRDCKFDTSINFQGSKFIRGIALTIETPGFYIPLCSFEGDARFDNSKFGRLVVNESHFEGKADFSGVDILPPFSPEFRGTIFSKHLKEGKLVPNVMFSDSFDLDDRGLPVGSIFRSNLKHNINSSLLEIIRNTDF